MAASQNLSDCVPIPPTSDELLASLRELVIDGEEMAFISYSIFGDSDADWHARWKQESPDWFAMIDRGRRLLARAGILIPPRQRTSRRRRAKCDECGRTIGHLVTCSQHRLNLKRAKAAR